MENDDKEKGEIEGNREARRERKEAMKGYEREEGSHERKKKEEGKGREGKRGRGIRGEGRLILSNV